MIRPITLPLYAAADTQAGGGGSDTQAGGAGKDTQAGGGGSDTQAGGAGKDNRTAMERAGDDTAPAGGGNDTMQGGAGLPEDWRDHFAGDDDEIKTELGRFKSPKDLGKALIEQKKRLRKGVVSDEPMPEDEGEAKEWRKARGIPDDPTGYKVPDSVKKVMTDADKPMVDAFMADQHKRGASQKQINDSLEFYFNLQEATIADQMAADEENAGKTAEQLRSAWGADFRANSKIVARAGKELIEGVDWHMARLPDGRRLGDIPAVSEFLLESGLRLFGEGAYEKVEDGGGKSIAAEKADLREQMKNKKAWNANTAGQKRYMEIIDLEAKRKGRVADAE